MITKTCEHLYGTFGLRRLRSFQSNTTCCSQTCVGGQNGFPHSSTLSYKGRKHFQGEGEEKKNMITYE